MAIRLLNLGLAAQPPGRLGCGLQDTLKIIFHKSGTFYSPEGPDHFTPPLPDGVFFQEGETWPDSGGAKPNSTGEAKYGFQEFSSPVSSEQAASVAGTATPTVVTFNVIHIP
jgi:hypothetical protein